MSPRQGTGWWRDVRHQRLLALDTVLLAVAGVLLWHVQQATWTVDGVTWLGLAGLTVVFCLVEVLPLHLEWAGQTYSLSMSEAPLVIGLLCLPSPLLIVARVLGGALALLVHRRQPWHKLSFNVVNQLLEACVAVGVYSALPASTSREVIVAGAGALAAVVTSSALSMGLVCFAIRLLVGHLDRRILRTFVAAGGFGIPVNVSIALIVVAGMRESALILVPVLIVGVALGAIYRAYINLRQRHTGLQTVYDFTRGIGDATSSEDGLLNVLSRTRSMLRSGRAAILLFTEDGQGVLRTVRADGVLQVEDYAADTADWPLAQVVTSGIALRIPQGDPDPGHQKFLAQHDARDALLAPIRLGGRDRGVLLVYDREGDIATYTVDDAQLFATISTHVGNVLDNSRLVDRLRYESSHDTLTGLANRAFFRDTLTSHLGAAKPRFALLLADLDRFKEVNDTLGHHHGDLLISEIGHRLADLAPIGATVARLGGDEFALVLPGFDRAAGLRFAAEIRDVLRAPCMLDGIAVEVDASIGVAAAPQDGLEEAILLKRADMAMYAAKSAGTGTEAYDLERDEYSPRRLALATQVRGALERGQFQLHYQPQLAASGGVVGVEALIRWNHPEYGQIAPGEFVPIAEQSGAITGITEWVLAEAITQLATWRTNGLDLRISVNVSMRNLLDGAIVGTILRQLKESGVPADRLTVEITETHVMSDPARTLPILHRLTGLGLRLSIDDFGTGYSSLSYLRQMPVQEIKIDKSFVLGLDEPDNRAIVAAIVSIAGSLGLETVAEGIETSGARDHLVGLGCTYLQGFHLATPMPAARFEEWLTAHRAAGRQRAAVPATRRPPLNDLSGT
jgi:diguanylate cyclase (GGDEF)-like protein